MDGASPSELVVHGIQGYSDAILAKCVVLSELPRSAFPVDVLSAYLANVTTASNAPVLPPFVQFQQMNYTETAIGAGEGGGSSRRLIAGGDVLDTSTVGLVRRSSANQIELRLLVPDLWPPVPFFLTPHPIQGVWKAVLEIECSYRSLNDVPDFQAEVSHARRSSRRLNPLIADLLSRDMVTTAGQLRPGQGDWLPFNRVADRQVLGVLHIKSSSYPLLVCDCYWLNSFTLEPGMRLERRIVSGQQNQSFGAILGTILRATSASET